MSEAEQRTTVFYCKSENEYIFHFLTYKKLVFYTRISSFSSEYYLVIRDWLLSMGRGGLPNGKIAGPKLFVPPPPLFLKNINFLRPPTIWLPPPLYVGLKLHVPPLPVISDQSLRQTEKTCKSSRIMPYVFDIKLSDRISLVEIHRKAKGRLTHHDKIA